MNRFFEKLFILLFSALGLAFAGVLVLQQFGIIDFVAFINSVNYYIIVLLAVVFVFLYFAVALILNRLPLSLNDVYVFTDKNIKAKISRHSIKKIVSRAAASVVGVKLKRTEILLDQYGNCLKISLSVIGRTNSEAVGEFRNKLDKSFEDHLGIKFPSYQIVADKVTYCYSMVEENLKKVADSVKALQMGRGNKYSPSEGMDELPYFSVQDHLRQPSEGQPEFTPQSDAEESRQDEVRAVQYHKEFNNTVEKDVLDYDKEFVTAENFDIPEEEYDSVRPFADMPPSSQDDFSDSKEYETEADFADNADADKPADRDFSDDKVDNDGGGEDFIPDFAEAPHNEAAKVADAVSQHIESVMDMMQSVTPQAPETALDEPTEPKIVPTEKIEKPEDAPAVAEPVTQYVEPLTVPSKAEAVETVKAEPVAVVEPVKAAPVVAEEPVKVDAQEPVKTETPQTPLREEPTKAKSVSESEKVKLAKEILQIVANEKQYSATSRPQERTVRAAPRTETPTAARSKRPPAGTPKTEPRKSSVVRNVKDVKPMETVRVVKASDQTPVVVFPKTVPSGTRVLRAQPSPIPKTVPTAPRPIPKIVTVKKDVTIDGDEPKKYVTKQNVGKIIDKINAIIDMVSETEESKNTDE